MWGEAVRVAAYLLNCTPTSSLSVDKIPDLSNVHTFGCNTYSKVLRHLRKLDSCTKKCKFIGYAPTGFRLWDENKRVVIRSRDVVFNENKTMKENIKEIKMGNLDEDMDSVSHNNINHSEVIDSNENEISVEDEIIQNS